MPASSVTVPTRAAAELRRVRRGLRRRAGRVRMPDFLLPDLGEGLTDAEILTWLVAVGDHTGYVVLFSAALFTRFG